MTLEGLQPIVEGMGVVGAPLVMADLCSAETEEQVLSTARQLAMGGVKIFRAGIWKPRTKPGGFEGIGKEGLGWLKRVKEETGMLVATEVATRRHVEDALEAGVDILRIGARTSANPFAVQEISDALKEAGKDVAVLVKNPVNPDLELWIGALERIYNAEAFVVREQFTGDSVSMAKASTGIRRNGTSRLSFIAASPISPSYATQAIWEAKESSYTALAAGSRYEVHRPDDRMPLHSRRGMERQNQQVTPEVFRIILSSLVLRNAEQDTESLQHLRQQIDRVDTELLDLYGKRMAISREIGKYKKEHSMPVVQESRYDDLIKSRVASAVQMGMSADFMKTVLQAIHEESVRQQIEILNRN